MQSVYKHLLSEIPSLFCLHVVSSRLGKDTCATWRLLLKRLLGMKQSKDIYDLIGIASSACADTN
jgi:hypothetical protein